MIFATVGTAHTPFDRFIEYINELPDELRKLIFLQSGNSVIKPLVKHKKFLSHEEFIKNVIHADLIISHGGFGILTECIKYGKKVIVIPRLHEYNEAVNPQNELTTYLSKRERMIFKFEIGMELSKIIYYMLELNSIYKNKYQSNIPQIIKNYLNNL